MNLEQVQAVLRIVVGKGHDGARVEYGGPCFARCPACDFVLDVTHMSYGDIEDAVPQGCPGVVVPRGWFEYRRPTLRELLEGRR